ncbi:MAG TPA: ATP-binding protein [Methylomirabilota bacterium]|nr:ATP-binding protein [Methylomirabilota bacterium]
MTRSMLDTVLSVLAEPVMVTDAAGVVTYANPAGVRRFAWDKVIGVPLATRVARWPIMKPDRTAVSVSEDPVAVALATREHVLDFRFTVETAPGRWEWFTANVVPLVEGDTIAGTVGVLHDITDAMRLEAALADHAARLEAIVDQANDTVVIVDAEGRILFTNAVGQRLLAPTSADETGAQRASRLEFRTIDGKVLPPERLPSSLAIAGVTVSDMELTIATDTGRRRLTAKAHPLRDAKGTIYAAVVTLKDVTDDVRIRDELEHAREAAEEANRLKDEFIAALSHELRTPLQPILGWTEVLRRHGSLDEVTAQALEAIRRNIRQQVRLVDDLLDLSRIVHGKFQLRFESFDLREHVRSAAEPFEETAALRRVRLTVTLPETPVLMWGDGVRVQQIASNLIANAVKFTPSGGYIGVQLVTSEREALLEVEDTGDGIAPEDIPVIFEAFRQGGSRRRGGLGIGLDLVKRLTELHGGTVDVFSEGTGYGARFQVRLPLATVPAPPPRRAAPGPRLDGRSILVVEDNADTRHVLKYMLEIEGARVEAVESGHEALARAQAFRPQVVLCDIGLPDIDGLEVARLLRDREELSDIRLIALTGYGQPDDIRHALDAGFEAHLTKPINLDQLLALLASSDAGA